jgi:hypothetical protein
VANDWMSAYNEEAAYFVRKISGSSPLRERGSTQDM